MFNHPKGAQKSAMYEKWRSDYSSLRLFNIPTTQLNTADFLFHPLLKVVKVKESQSLVMCHKIPSESFQDTVTTITHDWVMSIPEMAITDFNRVVIRENTYYNLFYSQYVEHVQ